jgi:hypothetical protein
MTNSATEASVDLSPEELASANRLLANYARFVDNKKGAEWQALFGRSGFLAFGDRKVTGDELGQFAVESMPGVHIQAVPHFERRPDGSVRAESSFVFVSAADCLIRSGYYLDELVLEDGEYVFASRTIDIRARN